MKKATIFILIIPAICILSCQSNSYDEVVGLADKSTYVADVAPIISENCIVCHSPNTNNLQPFLNTYEQVKEASVHGVLLCRINGTDCGGIMPQGGRMGQVKIDLIIDLPLRRSF